MMIIIIKDFEFKIIEPIVINIPNFKPEIVLDYILVNSLNKYLRPYLFGGMINIGGKSEIREETLLQLNIIFPFPTLTLTWSHHSTALLSSAF